MALSLRNCFDRNDETFRREKGDPGVFRLLHRGSIALVAAAAVLTMTAAPAQAAAKNLPTPTNGLVEVTDFGANPTGLQMFLYVPASVKKHPAVVVVLHYCTG